MSYLTEALNQLILLEEQSEAANSNITEKEIFKIPSINLEKLKSVIDKWKKKGAEIDFEILNKYYDEVDKVTYYSVKVKGGYKLDDWEFAGTIEHNLVNNEYANIVNAMPDFIGKLPKKFYTSRPECAHCRTERVRNETYIVYNTQSHEFKQVGKNCLKDYTGFDAKAAALNAEALRELKDYLEDDETLRIGHPLEYAENIKPILCMFIQKFGYNKDTFFDEFNDFLNDHEEDYKDLRTELKSEIDKIDAWVKTLKDSSSDYIRNAYSAWNLDKITNKHYKLVASLIASYYREQAKKNASANFNKLGNVGDKITFTAKTVRALYNKGSYNYRGPATVVYKIIDEKGNVIIWSTTAEPKEGDVITATIQDAEKEYKGEKQTIVTRGKIIESKPVFKYEPLKAKSSQELFDNIPKFNTSQEALEYELDLYGKFILGNEDEYRPEDYRWYMNPLDDCYDLIDQAIDTEKINMNYDPDDAFFDPPKESERYDLDKLNEWRKNLKSWENSNPDRAKFLRSLHR